MAKKKRSIPKKLFVQGAGWYELSIALVHTKHPDGSPALCKLIRDNDTIDLAGGEEFFTFFLPVDVLHPNRHADEDDVSKN